MALTIKNLLSKLELPTNDWVLSRFGGCEPLAPPPAPDNETLVEEAAAGSQRPASVAARLFERWLDQAPEHDSAQPPQSGERLSPNASGDAPAVKPDRESCAS